MATVRVAPKAAPRGVWVGLASARIDVGGGVAAFLERSDGPGEEKGCPRMAVEAHEQNLWAARLLRDDMKSVFEPIVAKEGVYHLVQNRSEIARMQAVEIPPEEYYNQLGPLLLARFPGVDPDLVEHVVLLVEAFDTATVFALSFGIAKFQLAQSRVKLVGEIVGREGRSPNPAIVRAIRN